MCVCGVFISVRRVVRRVGEEVVEEAEQAKEKRFFNILSVLTEKQTQNQTKQLQNKTKEEISQRQRRIRQRHNFRLIAFCLCLPSVVGVVTPRGSRSRVAPK